MTRTELNKLIAFHESRLAHILHLLNNHYFDMENTGDEQQWASLLTREKRILEGLKAMKADDEE